MAKSPRKLSFRDRFIWELEQTVLARFDTFDDFTERFVFPDLTTQVPLVLYLSQEEFTKLYSAVLTGADLTYPDQSHDIEYLYLQMVALPMAQLCTTIADCIDNSSDVSIAINQWLQNNGYGTGGSNPPQPLPPGVTGTTMLPPGYSCTNDAAYGMSLAVVNAIHDATLEVLQLIEILTNPLELAATMADNIPGAAVLTAGVELVAWIQDTAKENYDLSWSTVVRDELACLIWCDMLDGCELSFDTIWDIYVAETDAPTPPEDDLLSWLEWLVGLSFGTDTETVAIISLMGLIMMRWGGKFGQFTLGIRSLDMVIKLAEDETSNDWSIVCPSCGPQWCSFQDWSIDEQGWAKGGGAPAGIYDDPGWTYEDIKHPSTEERRRTISISKSFTAAKLTRIDLNLDFTDGMTTNRSALFFVTELATVVTVVNTVMSDDMPEGTDLHVIWDDPAGEQSDYLNITCRSSFDSSAPYVYAGNIHYHDVDVCGDNPEPGDL